MCLCPANPSCCSGSDFRGCLKLVLGLLWQHLTCIPYCQVCNTDWPEGQTEVTAFCHSPSKFRVSDRFSVSSCCLCAIRSLRNRNQSFYPWGTDEMSHAKQVSWRELQEKAFHPSCSALPSARQFSTLPGEMWWSILSPALTDLVTYWR